VFLLVVSASSVLMASTPPPLPDRLPPQILIRNTAEEPQEPHGPIVPLTRAALDRLALSPTLYDAMVASMTPSLPATGLALGQQGSSVQGMRTDRPPHNLPIAATALGTGNVSTNDPNGAHEPTEPTVIVQR